MIDFNELENSLPKVEFPLLNLFNYFLAGAEHGIAFAQWKVGNCYYSGRLVEQSFALARYWYEKSAAQGLYLGQRDLAYMQKQGLGGAVDLAGAIVNFEKSARSCGKAALEAAHAYLFGMGVTSDKNKAKVFYQIASRQNQDLGDEIYAFLGAMDLYPLSSTGEQHEILRHAHRMGNLDASFALGEFFAKGRHGKNSKHRAVQYFSHAASKGHVQAQLAMARCELMGFGCEKNIASGLRQLDQLIKEHELLEAYYLKGSLYLIGEEVEEDIEAALHWLEPAAKGEHPVACHAKAACLAMIKPPSVKLFFQIAELLKKAHQGGFGNGIAELADFFSIGDEPFSLEAPFYYECLEASASKGESKSMFKLAKYHMLDEGGKDEVRGLFWTAAAIEESYPEAPGLLADWIEKNNGRAFAVRALHIWGADFGSADSAIWLARHLDSDPSLDRRIVARYYLLASKYGDVSALDVLTRMFAEGDGVPQDESTADMFFELYMQRTESEHPSLARPQPIERPSQMRQNQVHQDENDRSSNDTPKTNVIPLSLPFPTEKDLGSSPSQSLSGSILEPEPRNFTFNASKERDKQSVMNETMQDTLKAESLSSTQNSQSEPDLSHTSSQIESVKDRVDSSLKDYSSNSVSDSDSDSDSDSTAHSTAYSISDVFSEGSSAEPMSDPSGQTKDVS